MQLKEVCQPMPESDDGRTEMTYVRSSTVHDDTQRKKKHDSKVDDRTLLWEKKLFFSIRRKKKEHLLCSLWFSLWRLAVLSVSPACSCSCLPFFFLFSLLQLPFYKSFVPSAASLSLFFQSAAAYTTDKKKIVQLLPTSSLHCCGSRRAGLLAGISTKRRSPFLSPWNTHTGAIRQQQQ